MISIFLISKIFYVLPKAKSFNVLILVLVSMHFPQSIINHTLHLFQVKIWFQNRRTKWKKHDHITNVEAAEHKTTPPKIASTKSVPPNPISVDAASQSSSIKKCTSKPSNPVTAELNAKLTARHNNKMKNLKIFAKSEKFDIVDTKSTNFLVEEKTRENIKHNLLIDGTNDVESRYAASKISVNSHKEKSGYL